jgi:hypothetical protein
MEEYSIILAIGIVQLVTWLFHVFTLFIIVLMVDKEDHCNRCMTRKEPKYEYPLSDRDVGRNILGIKRLMIELPKGHGKNIVKKKGEWACAACGELNLGISSRIVTIFMCRELS